MRISIGGLILIIVSILLLYPEDTLSVALSGAILLACIVAYLVRQQYPTLSVIIISVVTLAAMAYQRLAVANTSTTLAVVLIIGTLISVMLKGKVLWIMHSISFLIINTIFVYHLPDAVTAAITYSILYFILAYATGVLKQSYDKIQENLMITNKQLNDKAKEIESQNEELLQIQEHLSTLNSNLEKIVNERTTKIQFKTTYSSNTVIQTRIIYEGRWQGF